MRKFSDLNEREILALAIGLEEEHGRIFADYAHGLQEHFPSSAKVFQEMAVYTTLLAIVNLTTSAQQWSGTLQVVSVLSALSVSLMMSGHGP